jgi:antitoxin MazE
MSKEFTIQVWKWGSSLAVRLPDPVVDALDLKEGDEIDLRIAGSREIEISRDRSREAAIQQLRKLRRPFPAGFKFHRHQSEHG